MKALKKLAVEFVLFAGFGLAFASCSDDIYYENPVQPLPPTAENPIGVTPDPY